MKRLFMILGFFVATFGICLCISKAATQIVAKTSLYISPGSTLTGAKRKHNYSNQSIEFNWTKVEEAGARPPYLTVALNKKGFLFYDTIAKDNVTVPKGTTFNMLRYNNTGSGNYYFDFSTGSASNPSGFFQADVVNILSFT